MNQQFVFDTEAIIAFLYRESGHEVIRSLLDDVFFGDDSGYIAEINATEVCYLLARFNGIKGRPTEDSLRNADLNIRGLERQGLSIEAPTWQLAAKIKADGSISLADAYAVALSHERSAVLVVGADNDFDDLPVTIEILRFREHAA